MKVIAIGALTAGGKTTVVNILKKKIVSSESLHFDDYEFEGQVEDYYQWVKDGADYNKWNLKPLLADIIRLKNAGICDYLFLDYPFAYCNDMIKQYIDLAIFIDTPLDVVLARGVLRDMKNSDGEDIRNWLKTYLEYSRIAFVQMQKDIRPSSDYIVDGMMDVENIVNKIIKYIKLIDK